MKKLVILLITVPIILGLKPDWGFYGHRLINKMAVFSLPPEMLGFYKANINFLSDHAVDPDKRRYATKHEGVRHYIDIDNWGEYPFYDVPRRLDDALIKYSGYHLISGHDTLDIQSIYDRDTVMLVIPKKDTLYYDLQDFKAFWNSQVMPQYYEDKWKVGSDSLSFYLGRDFARYELLIEDEFSSEGILPYHLLSMKYKLTDAFREKNLTAVLRLSAEFGHYLGDAHVPLHTTVNYNGQLSNQEGIHAFWESRIPELFAERHYDFIVGKAEYIEFPSKYFWDIVLESHRNLSEVLRIEKELSLEFPEDKQYCYDERLDRTIRIQCPEYAEAYSDAMNGMVEERMTSAILSIASIWYTCWVDAGMPDLEDLTKIEIETDEIKIDPNVKSNARSHEF